MIATLLSMVALAGPPPPATPIPTTPAALAQAYEQTTRELGAAVDAWRASGRPRAPKEVTLYALYQQRILIRLSERRALSKAVLSRLPEPRPARTEILARRELVRLSRPRPLSAFRTGPAEPAGRLRAYYGQAQRRFGVAWNVLAAVNYVESAFNRLRNASTAGAQGPMQFLPATWRAYGLGGNIHDPHDAILAAANYLHANGAPGSYPRALFHYNPSWLYVDAVLRYSSLVRADPDTYLIFHSRQVFVRTPHGLVRLTGPR